MPNTSQLNNGQGLAERHLYKLTEAAGMLSLSVVSLRRLIKNGTIRPHRKTRHILISRAEIERFASA
jgi:excisionase family DNA binding protein